MKKIFVTGLLILLFLILDNACMYFLNIESYYPSLLFVFIICFSIINGKWQGLWVGVFAGLLQDIYFLNAFGINSLLNMIVCIIAGEIGKNIFKNKRLIPVASAFGLTIFKGLGLYVILDIIGQHANMGAIFYDALYGMVVCLLMYRPIYKLYNKNSMKKEWKF